MDKPDFYYTCKLLSWIFYLAAISCVIIYVVKGFEYLMILIIGIVFFLLAYFISPHHKKASDRKDLLLDESIIELTFSIIIFPIRILIKGLHHLFD